jgi:DNA-directed RNA polymerase subunit RPC12/RpoP
MAKRDFNNKGIRPWDAENNSLWEYSLSARLGKYYCPYCNNSLQIKAKTEIVKPPEENKFLRHNTEYHWDVFYCANCDKELSLDVKGEYPNQKENRKWIFLEICLFVALIVLVIYIVIHVPKW